MIRNKSVLAFLISCASLFAMEPERVSSNQWFEHTQLFVQSLIQFTEKKIEMIEGEQAEEFEVIPEGPSFKEITSVVSNTRDLRTVEHIILVIGSPNDRLCSLMEEGTLTAAVSNMASVIEQSRKSREVAAEKAAIPLDMRHIKSQPATVAIITYQFINKFSQIELSRALLAISRFSKVPLSLIAQQQTCSIINTALSAEEFRSGSPIDTLIYFQSSIDSKTKAPLCRRLYNFYTNAASSYLASNKYMQSVAYDSLYNLFIMPVRNIRLVHINGQGQLADISLQNILSEAGIFALAQVMVRTDNYLLNFDFLAKLFDSRELKDLAAIYLKDQDPSEEANLAQVYDARPPEMLPVIVVDQFVSYDGHGALTYKPYSSSGAQTILTPELIAKYHAAELIESSFIREFERALVAVNNLAAIPTEPSGLSWLFGSLQSDMSRIRQNYLTILAESPLLARMVPVDPFVQHIEDAFDQMNREELFPVSKTFAFKNMLLGRHYYHALLAGRHSEIPHDTQVHYLDSIVAMVWYLYALALYKHQGFIEGTFVIQDSDRAFYNYLIDYISLYGAPITKDPYTDKGLHISYNPFGYPSVSSHYIFQQKTLCHYGIDIRAGAAGAELPLLPAAKRHLLFGLIDDKNNLVFIKPENYGLYYRDGIPMHGLELAASLARKSAAATGFLGNLVIAWLGADDAPGNRKERVPHEFAKAVAKLIAVSGRTDEEKKRLARALSILGLKVLTDESFIEQLPGLAAFLPIYGPPEYDHLRLRTGREVILTTKELAQ